MRLFSVLFSTLVVMIIEQQKQQNQQQQHSNCSMFVSGKQNEGYDLDSDAPLRVGVKKRIPANQCQFKSKKEDILKVHYVGTLYKNGKEFDSSRERNDPFRFTLGETSVIPGWDQGLSNMCIGEIRKLTIPSDLAYGNEGAPPDIHPGATLVFEIELVDIIDKERNLDEYLDYIELSHFTEL